LNYAKILQHCYTTVLQYLDHRFRFSYSESLMQKRRWWMVGGIFTYPE